MPNRFNVGDLLEYGDGSVQVKILRNEPDRYARDRKWVRVVKVGRGMYEFLFKEGEEGFMDVANDDWRRIEKLPTKKEQALGIECSSCNQRREK